MVVLIVAAALSAFPANNGALISLADGKRVMAAAEAKAAKLKVSATIVIVDRYGELAMAGVAAGAQGAAFEAALARARSVVNHDGEAPRLPPKAGDPRARISAAPLVSGDQMVGAIADAGDVAWQVAKAGAEAIK